jgi:beta propeller repeat protein
MKNKLFSISLIIIFLASMAVLASAGRETRLTTNGMSIEPTIHTNIITWTDDTNGLGIVHMYNLNTGKDMQINSSKAYYSTNSADTIVWVDERSEKPNLLVFNTKTGSSYHITENLNLSYGIPRCCCNYVVWCGNDANVYMYNLVTNKQTQITHTGSAANPATCCNDKVVYQDHRNGHWNIYRYNIIHGGETQITSSGTAYNPKTCGDRIVYQDFRNGISDVYLYDLNTRKETRISNSGKAYYPWISYKKIVWEDFRNGNPAVYMYDLDNSKETLITTGNADQYYPTISNNEIVWQALQNDTVNGSKTDIYAYNLNIKPDKPQAAFTANITTGNAPLSVSFTDNSTGQSLSWHWNFGDKTTSTDKNPVHTYKNSGKYTVTLTVTNEGGSNTVTKTNYINVTTPLKPPVADFTATPTSVKVSAKVSFKDKSTGNPSKWMWTFGDNTSSTTENPTHAYRKAGKYTVSLTVTNLAGNNTTTKSKYITVK